jgi:LysM repeat protein
MRILFNILFFSILLCAGSTYASPIDSVKVVKSKNKQYILHKVDKGEGFLSIARRYNVSVEDIKASNNNIKALKLGQKIKIPLSNAQPPVGKNDAPKKINGDSSRIKVEESHANADAKETTTSSYKIHIVQPGETVYKIAAKYKITTQQLINWNAVKNNKIDLGQELIVSGALATLSYEKWNTANSLTSKASVPQNVLSPDTARVEESGFAIQMDENTHPGIAPGTLILAINPDNNKQCLVQIQRKGPAAENAVIGLDKETLKRLGVEGNQSRIIIKYNQ